MKFSTFGKPSGDDGPGAFEDDAKALPGCEAPKRHDAMDKYPRNLETSSLGFVLVSARKSPVR
jgi:hypothetical protein